MPDVSGNLPDEHGPDFVPAPPMSTGDPAVLTGQVPVEHNHDECCMACDTHVTPHRNCILR